MSDATRRRTTRGLVAVVATALLAVIVVLLLLAQPAGESVVAPSPTASASATGASPSATTTASASATSPATSAVKPDAQHGLITRSPAAIRTEADPAALNKTPNWDDGAAIGVSPDGRRVAVLRSSQTGQGIIVFTTAKPDDIAYVIDMAGTGELIVGPPVWAGDGSDSLLIGVVKPGAQSGVEPPPAYSALRSVDVRTRAVTEVVRVTNQFVMLPVAWHPASNAAAAVETGPGGFAYSYVVVQSGRVTRETFEAQPPQGLVSAAGVRASPDGRRVLALFGRDSPSAVRWCPSIASVSRPS